MLMGGFRPKALVENSSSDGTASLVCTTDDAATNKRFEAMVGASLPCGNEGAGTVVRAGSAAQHMLGKIVAVQGEAYAQYRKVNMNKCIPHNEGTTAPEAASSFVNPMTVLCMVETMAKEKHNAIIHTAAASNLVRESLYLFRRLPIVCRLIRGHTNNMLHTGSNATKGVHGGWNCFGKHRA